MPHTGPMPAGQTPYRQDHLPCPITEGVELYSRLGSLYLAGGTVLHQSLLSLVPACSYVNFLLRWPHSAPAGPVEPLPSLTSWLWSSKPWEVQPEEPACRALCFITIYCSCYFNIYGVRLSCELASPASLWSESLQGAGQSVSLIPVLMSALSTLLKTLFCLGLPLFSELLCMWPQVYPKPLDTILSTQGHLWWPEARKRAL